MTFENLERVKWGWEERALALDPIPSADTMWDGDKNSDFGFK